MFTRVSEGFYRELSTFSDPRGVCMASNFHPAPDDWVVVLTDVRGSTAAIEAGRYRAVNMVGASSIIAVLNAVKRTDLPYVFGGDGATLLVPPDALPAVTRALVGVRAMSRREFGLDLRLGAVSVAEVRRAGANVEVARYALSSGVSLAMFRGGGLELAERLVKGPGAERYALGVADEGGDPEPANFEGLECRWKPIPSGRGEILSVLVKASAGSEAERVYREVIEELEAIGGSERELSPVRTTRLRVATDPRALGGETMVRTTGKGMGARLKYLLGVWLKVLLGVFLFRFRMRAFGIDFGRYLDEVETNSDFWKFDDMLRFVIDVTPAQRRALEACLQAHQNKGELVYGLHSAGEALMTCLVFDMSGHHVHFIDGGDGGYALAARQLKSSRGPGPSDG